MVISPFCGLMTGGYSGCCRELRREKVMIVEFRDGCWTSRTQKGICEEIVSLANRIENGDGNSRELARKIQQSAQELARYSR